MWAPAENSKKIYSFQYIYQEVGVLVRDEQSITEFGKQQQSSQERKKYL